MTSPEPRRPPRVLISYAHGGRPGRPEAQLLHDLLRAHGIDCRLDAVGSEEPRDWTVWMETEIRSADRVLMVVSAGYRDAFDDDRPVETGRGSRWEARLIRDALVGDQRAGRRKFLTVLLPGSSTADIPMALQPNAGTHYLVESFTYQGAETLIRLLVGQPAWPETDLPPIPLLPPRRRGLTAVLWLTVLAPAPRDRRALVRRFLDSVADGDEVTTVVPVDEDEAGILIPLASATNLVGRCIGLIHAEVTRRSASGSEVDVVIGVDIEETASPEVDVVARRLARSPAATELHQRTGVHVVVATSERYRAWAVESRCDSPRIASFARRPINPPDNETCWIAVPGFSQCPRPTRRTATAVEDEARAPRIDLRHSRSARVFNQESNGVINIYRDRGGAPDE